MEVNRNQEKQEIEVTKRNFLTRILHKFGTRRILIGKGIFLRRVIAVPTTDERKFPDETKDQRGLTQFMQYPG